MFILAIKPCFQLNNPKKDIFASVDCQARAVQGFYKDAAWEVGAVAHGGERQEGEVKLRYLEEGKMTNIEHGCFLFFVSKKFQTRFVETQFTTIQVSPVKLQKVFKLPTWSYALPPSEKWGWNGGGSLENDCLHNFPKAQGDHKGCSTDDQIQSSQAFVTVLPEHKEQFREA